MRTHGQTRIRAAPGQRAGAEVPASQVGRERPGPAPGGGAGRGQLHVEPRPSLLPGHGQRGMSSGLLGPPVSGTQLWQPSPRGAPSPHQLSAIPPSRLEPPDLRPTFLPVSQLVGWPCALKTGSSTFFPAPPPPCPQHTQLFCPRAFTRALPLPGPAAASSPLPPGLCSKAIPSVNPPEVVLLVS